jgi:hypothetical protein
LERKLYIRLEDLEGDAFDEILRELRRTSLYAHRTQRATKKNRAELRSMQSEHKAYEKAQEEAILLTQIAYSKGQTVDAAKEFPSPELCGGFVYSMTEILRILDREARLEEARTRFLTAA